MDCWKNFQNKHNLQGKKGKLLKNRKLRNHVSLLQQKFSSKPKSSQRAEILFINVGTVMYFNAEI